MDSPELERHAASIAQSLGLQTQESRPRVEGIALTLSAQNVSLTLDRVKRETKRTLGKVGFQVLRTPYKGDETFEVMVFADSTPHGSSHLFMRYMAPAKEFTMACIRSSDELLALRMARK